MSDDKKLKEQMVKWRHHFHENPEIAFREVKTAAFLAGELRRMGLDVHEGIGKTGVVADLKVGNGNTVIGLRADMDAICLPETGTVSYQSRNEGVMHACGHDGHMATLLGAVKILSETRNFNGTVRCIFQPAEEPGRGSQAMIDDHLLTDYPMDEIYGLHNVPFIPAGEIHTRKSGIMASEDNFIIRIHGKGGHASSPHMGTDPLVIASQVILGLQTIVSRSANPLEPAVVSCTELLTDGAHNAIPSNVEIRGDTRSCSPGMQQLIEDRMRAISENSCQMYGAGCEFIYTHEFTPVVNWDACTETAINAAAAVVGPEHVNANCNPWMASEDFGIFLKYIPGCFVFLGSGICEKAKDNIMVHNSDYDYNDEVLLTGAKFFAMLIAQRILA